MTNTQTNTYKREFKFLDSQRNLVTAEAGITERNGYPEFTASGEYAGSLGQVFDHVKPANEAQSNFLKLWKQYHLNGMNAGTDKQAEATKDCKDYDASLRRLITTNKEGNQMDKENADLMLKIWDELQAEIPPVPTIGTFGMSEKERKEFFFFNMVARYGGNEMILLSGGKDESLKSKAEKWFFAKETLLYDSHPDTGKPYRYGSEWIRKSLPEDFENTLDTCINEIEEAEEDRKGQPLAGMNDSDLITLIEKETDFEGRDAELCAALCKMFDLTENDLQDIEIDENNVTVQGTEYLAGDDDEMNEELKDNIKQSVWAFNSSFLASFTDIDEDVFAVLSEKCEGGNDAILSLIEKTGGLDSFVEEAASADGRGHFLNRYDGGEEEQTINGTTYFAYRN